MASFSPPKDPHKIILVELGQIPLEILRLKHMPMTLEFSQLTRNGHCYHHLGSESGSILGYSARPHIKQNIYVYANLYTVFIKSRAVHRLYTFFQGLNHNR